MKSRIMQLVARYVSLGCGVACGWAFAKLGIKADSTETSIAIGTAVASFVGIIADHYLHKVQERLGISVE